MERASRKRVRAILVCNIARRPRPNPEGFRKNVGRYSEISRKRFIVFCTRRTGIAEPGSFPKASSCSLLSSTKLVNESKKRLRRVKPLLNQAKDQIAQHIYSETIYIHLITERNYDPAPSSCGVSVVPVESLSFFRVAP